MKIEIDCRGTEDFWYFVSYLELGDSDAGNKIGDDSFQGGSGRRVMLIGTMMEVVQLTAMARNG